MDIDDIGSDPFCHFRLVLQFTNRGVHDIREMLRDPYWPYHAALKLGDEKAATILPVQYARAVKAR